MKKHYSSFFFHFKITDAEKKSLLWNVLKRYPDYDKDIDDSRLIKDIVARIRSQYGPHRKSYLRFCTALTVSIHRINYLEGWFSQCTDALHFLVSLPVFTTFSEKEKSSIQKFVEKFEITASQVWFISTQVRDQVNSARNLSTVLDSLQGPTDTTEEGDELEDAA